MPTYSLVSSKEVPWYFRYLVTVTLLVSMASSSTGGSTTNNSFANKMTIIQCLFSFYGIRILISSTVCEPQSSRELSRSHSLHRLLSKVRKASARTARILKSEFWFGWFGLGWAPFLSTFESQAPPCKKLVKSKR